MAVRGKLTVQIAAVNAFVAGANMTTLGRMEPMLEKIFYYLDRQAKGGLNAAQTVLSAQVEITDEEDGASWARLEMELRTEGIPREYMRDNRERIRNVLGSVVERNHLNGLDDVTVMPSDSASQVGKLEQGSPGTDSSQLLTAQTKTPKKKSFRLSRPLPSRRERPKLDEPKMQRAPYEDWVNRLSTTQHAARKRLMNHGFDIRYVEQEVQARESRQLEHASFEKRSKETFFLFRKLSETVPAPGPPNHHSKEGKAVLWAVKRNDQTALKLLLERGCYPFPVEHGETAALLAAKAKDWDTVKILLQSGNQKDIFLGTQGLIQEAARANKVDMISMLLDLGIYVDGVIRTQLGNSEETLWCTALHCAAYSNHFEAASLLLKRGANAKTKVKDTATGDDALMLSLQRLYYIKPMLNSLDLFSLLLEYGPNMDRPLIFLAFYYRWSELSNSQILVDMVSLLLHAGANVNARDKLRLKEYPGGPLHGACITGNAPLVELLLREGAELNAAGEEEFNKPPLAFASDSHIARLLIDYGADYHKYHEHLWSLLPTKLGPERDEYIRYLMSKDVPVRSKWTKYSDKSAIQGVMM